MIAAAADDLRARLLAVLDQAGLAHGEARSWGGARRLAVHVAAVAPGLAGREELVLGPPVSAAFDASGRPTPAGSGFAKKQGVDPSALQRIETEKGTYAAIRRAVPGRSLERVLADALPASVAAMTFPKTMRWGDGTHRWVRPVHWIVALHGADVLKLEILGATSGRQSDGHRFLAPGPVPIEEADRYADALRAASVLVDASERRTALAAALDVAASSAGGTCEADGALLDEVVELIEWPGVVVGRFDPTFLELPKEILVTTLRHHQKSFSVRGRQGLLPVFLSVANTDRDPAGHVRRGNEWVVGGRLEDARFFWAEDRKRTLASRGEDLARVTFHKKLGSYADKAQRIAKLADAMSLELKLSAGERTKCVEAACLAKNDLVTGLVGEFPELQGVVGGLLLRAEGADSAIADAVAEQYKPVSASDSIPSSDTACVVAVADRLDTMVELLAVESTPTGSRDPFGLRRAASGIFRILSERRWQVTITDLYGLTGQQGAFYSFVQERLDHWLRDQGFGANEIAAVQKRQVSDTAYDTWPLSEIIARLNFLGSVRSNPDFQRLVDLTKRVDNICRQVYPVILEAQYEPRPYQETAKAALALREFHTRMSGKIREASEAHKFDTVISSISSYVEPIGKFFDDVLVLDRSNLDATWERTELLSQVRSALTNDFDIRELAGQADAKR